MKRIVSLVVLIAFVAGCGVVPMTDRERTVTESALLGGAAGAALGAYLGDRLKDDPVLGAFIGGWLGMLGGGLYGQHVANQKNNFVGQEEYLDGCIREAQKVNTQTRHYNASLKNDIYSIEQEASRLRSQYNQGLVQRSALKAKQEEVDQKFEEAVKQLRRTSDEILIQKEVRRREAYASQQKLAEMDAEIAQLEQSAEELAQSTDALASISRRVRV